MAVTVETLEKQERKMTLEFPVGAIQSEIDTRLKNIARTLKMHGFRPGKVPLSVVTRNYGRSVHVEVMQEKFGQAFDTAATEAQLRVAGHPVFQEGKHSSDGSLAVDAFFEVFPEVNVGDLTTLQIEKVTTEVSDGAIDKTVDILRKQRCTFEQRPKDAIAQEGDRLTVDFEGKIDGETFSGGTVNDHMFILGEGQMLKAFEVETNAMRVGESKTFPLTFPTDYQSLVVAGKTADFLVTVKKIEAVLLPEINDVFVKSLGTEELSVNGMRADINKSLNREVKFRLLARNRAAVMDALASHVTLDLPKISVQTELNRLIETARADLKIRGIKNADKVTINDAVLRPQAQRRVLLSLILNELVQINGLQATKEQIRSYVEELSASYENPADVFQWYFNEKDRLTEIEAIVIENNVTNYVLSQAKVIEKSVPFDELLTQN